MDVEVGRDTGVDRVEEGAELLGPVALVTLADHLAGRHVQGREERGRAVADVVVRAPLGLTQLLSLPRFRGHPGSHESAVGVCHGKTKATSILG